MLRPLFFLDEPQHHHLTGRGPLRFRGAALAIDGEPVETVRIRCEGRVVAETAVDKPCPELTFLPFPRAPQSRFEVTAERESGAYEISIVDAKGAEAAMFRLEGQGRRDLWPCIDAMPRPAPELVATTQGGQDVRSYLNSMVSGLHTLESLLRASGVDPNAMQTILDIGCGTGRLLMGWHCASSRRRLVGADINAELIAWNQANLPGEWDVCGVLPPLKLAGGEFDLVQLASVFTHLPLHHQREWIEEIRRLLRPGGVLLMTLHGAVYMRIFGQSGEYAEQPAGAIGSNAFATFHSRPFAERLFTGFELLGYFERGHDSRPPSLFPIAALQDVYVLRKV
jgi:SAM-dependent methyltransferase